MTKPKSNKSKVINNKIIVLLPYKGVTDVINDIGIILNNLSKSSKIIRVSIKEIK